VTTKAPAEGKKEEKNFIKRREGVDDLPAGREKGTVQVKEKRGGVGKEGLRLVEKEENRLREEGRKAPPR